MPTLALSEFQRYWLDGGPLMAPIAAASVGIWFHFLRLHRRLRTVAPGRFEDSIVTAIQQRPLAAVESECRATPGALAAAVAYALDAIRHREVPGAAFLQYENTALSQLGRDLIVIMALATVAPLLGLLGTVGGMVETFNGVAGAGSGDTATQVSSGVSQALIATQFGLIVAIPGMFGVARLQRMLDQTRLRFARCHNHLVLALKARDEARIHHATLA